MYSQILIILPQYMCIFIISHYVIPNICHMLYKNAIYIIIYVKVKVSQLCLTLCEPMDYTVCGILQARILEWVAVPFSRGSS